MGESEVFLKCPYCWQNISMILDASTGAQSYVEDCEVCCRPIQVSYNTDGSEISGVVAQSLDE